MLARADAIGISVTVANTLPHVNNLTASDKWPLPGLLAGPCDFGNSTNRIYSPAGVAIFKGNYGTNNVSRASTVPIWAMIECPVALAYNNTGVGGQLVQVSSYSFFPGQANGTLAGTYYSYQSNSMHRGVFPILVSTDVLVYANNRSGYQSYNSLLSSLPSNYTVAAGDEWGQLALLHFSVLISNALPVTGQFLAATGGCAENGFPVPCITFEFSQAYIFNCAAAAATPQGCVAYVNSTFAEPQYQISVWYRRFNQTDEPGWANCMYQVPHYDGSPYGHCFLVNSTAFAVSLDG